MTDPITTRRTLLIEISRDGIVEIEREPTDDELRELGLVRFAPGQVDVTSHGEPVFGASAPPQIPPLEVNGSGPSEAGIPREADGDGEARPWWSADGRKVESVSIAGLTTPQGMPVNYCDTPEAMQKRKAGKLISERAHEIACARLGKPLVPGPFDPKVHPSTADLVTAIDERLGRSA